MTVQELKKTYYEAKQHDAALEKYEAEGNEEKWDAEYKEQFAKHEEFIKGLAELTGTTLKEARTLAGTFDDKIDELFKRIA